MIEIVNKFEKVIYAVLIILLMAVLLAAVLDLAWVLITTLSDVTPWLLETHEMISVLGAFLLVLIGVELLDTIKAYFSESAIHVEIVVLLAIIAIARKVILLDPAEMSGTDFGIQMIGIGVIMAGLSACYYLLKKAGLTIGPGMQVKDRDG